MPDDLIGFCIPQGGDMLEMTCLAGNIGMGLMGHRFLMGGVALPTVAADLLVMGIAVRLRMA